jgi:dTMP kinase
MRGAFITLEGIDGAGKSTHLAWLERFLKNRGVIVKVTREPGGTPLGEKLRELLLDRSQQLHPETETLLMFGARREHLAKIIAPALAEGSWVLCDRFTDATYAYQSGGSGVAWDKIELLEQWVQPEVRPDLTLLLDVSPEIGRLRTSRIKAPDRFEQERTDFYERVRAAYIRRAGEAPQRVALIDAGAPIEHVQHSLAAAVEKLLGDRRGSVPADKAE